MRSTFVPQLSQTTLATFHQAPQQTWECMLKGYRWPSKITIKDSTLNAPPKRKPWCRNALTKECQRKESLWKVISEDVCSFWNVSEACKQCPSKLRRKLNFLTLEERKRCTFYLTRESAQQRLERSHLHQWSRAFPKNTVNKLWLRKV